MRTRIAIRADASVEIGTGHIMRCAALGSALRERGADVGFLCRQLPAGYAERLTGAGFSVARVEGDGRLDFEIDARQSIVALRTFGRPDWLIVDHYDLDATWETALRPYVGRIMAVDDLANRPHDCDLLLDQNHYADAETRYRERVPPGCRQLLGPRFALLRPQFAVARRHGRRREAMRRLLICLGGADADNLTARAVDAFLAAGLADWSADVVVGAANPHWPDLEGRYGQIPSLKLHRDVADMAALMAEADMFLGAGGSMTWERAAVGLPGLTVAVAPNQVGLCEDLERVAAGIHLGGPGTESEVIADVLQVIARHPKLLSAMGERLAAFADGRGTARVVRILMPEVINLRPARDEDCDQLHAWRNAPGTRRFSGGGAEITLEAHRAWFAATLADPAHVLLVGESIGVDGESTPVGVLRYDLDDEQATISVYLVPGREGAGLGAAMIEAGDRWLGRNHPEMITVRARISPENRASLGAFRAAGYAAEASLFMKRL
jgi:UDP-2,4-diacetamido-2,4,6-trideoxy-beta-L-altropyranose hydrolase